MTENSKTMTLKEYLSQYAQLTSSVLSSRIEVDGREKDPMRIPMMSVRGNINLVCKVDEVKSTNSVDVEWGGGIAHLFLCLPQVPIEKNQLRNGSPNNAATSMRENGHILWWSRDRWSEAKKGWPDTWQSYTASGVVFIVGSTTFGRQIGSLGAFSAGTRLGRVDAAGVKEETVKTRQEYSKLLPRWNPDPYRVLESLFSDADCVESCPMLDDFASEFGYDMPLEGESLTAAYARLQAAYSGCMDSRKKLITLIGSDLYRKVNDARRKGEVEW